MAWLLDMMQVVNTTAANYTRMYRVTAQSSSCSISSSSSSIVSNMIGMYYKSFLGKKYLGASISSIFTVNRYSTLSNSFSRDCLHHHHQRIEQVRSLLSGPRSSGSEYGQNQDGVIPTRRYAFVLIQFP